MFFVEIIISMQQPISVSENERIWALTEFDIDYSDSSVLLKD